MIVVGTTDRILSNGKFSVMFSSIFLFRTKFVDCPVHCGTKIVKSRHIEWQALRNQPVFLREKILQESCKRGRG